ncbi:hypothetical protein [Curtobacterium sp. MCBD17_040]|uniref:hypothetical protein n=1 Tax=Curtobacterium sp. MCBD17_040 TaxID=2175674 RepID=UPI0011B4C117|nr:hypothetical protein [Curtobacterium sp. MCBD17_040]WIB65740.1 hypothetical protein DEI94_16610 [Curtobacterium sp. MCBD17_040]
MSDMFPPPGTPGSPIPPAWDPSQDMLLQQQQQRHVEEQQRRLRQAQEDPNSTPGLAPRNAPRRSVAGVVALVLVIVGFIVCAAVILGTAHSEGLPG